MTLAHYMADTSALSRLRVEPVAEVLRPLTDRGLTGICGVIALELQYSGRSGDDLRKIARWNEMREWLPTEDDDLRRAVEVQRELAKSGRHRAASPADLIIAAVAERCQIAVLHYDADFDLIAEVTGQPTEWVVERGSVN